MATQSIDVKMFTRMFISGANNLEANKAWINDLNVFPVPDGDTGTNMSLTLTSAVKEVSGPKVTDMASAAKAVSFGSLRGARGNSGVITSQLLRGFCKVLQTKETVDAAAIAEASVKAVETAYKAVMKPKEGTILTVARGVSEKWNELAAEETDLEKIFEQVLDHGDKVLAYTPELLPVLKEAGVVDSGGQGLMVFLKGAYACMMGREVTAGETAEAAGRKAEPEDKYTYRVSYGVKQKHPLSQEQEAGFKSWLEAIGDHADVSSDCDVLHVAVETDDPGLVLQKGMKYGSLIGVAVLNKREEKEAVKAVPAEPAEEAPAAPAKAAAFVKTTVPESEWKEIGFIATAVGDGLAEVFRSLGVDAIVQGGQTMNPSTEDMLEAIESVPAKAIVILPNNKNIILAAQQAQKLCKSRKVEVLPTTNIPEGITAMSCFMPEDPLEDNLSMMREAFASVKSGEVTYAVRNTQIAGMEIHEGDFMGLGGPQGIYAVGKDKMQVLLDTIAAMVDEGSGMITLYYGEDVKEEEGEALRDKLTKLYPDCDIDVICGGQPVYSFIASVE